jgi:sensor histidine kinase regulating citrate/malate metabolism
MTADLETTNLFLGVIAAVSALEVVALLVICVGALILVRRIVRLVDSLEANQIAPTAARIHAILDDVKEATSTVRTGAGWIDKLTNRIFDKSRHA